MNDALQAKLRSAPKRPGCYLFSDSQGRILYVGKAKILANRVRSYFHAGAKEDDRIRLLVPKIEDVEFVVTTSETDALLQEYHLIKRHKPWFNSQMKRDTKRPFVRIDTASEYPSISISEEACDDGAEYFGSFSDFFDAQETIEAINNVWRTQLCMRPVLPAKSCLYRALNRCSAPCVKGVDSAEYRAVIDEVAALLRGECPGKAARIEQEMEAHIQSLAFEKAAASREKLWALEHLSRKCQKLFRLHDGQNAIVLIRAYRAPECVLFNIRHGAVINRAYILPDYPQSEMNRLILECLLPDPTVSSETWLGQCITEVFADKAFLRIPENQPEAQTVQAAIEQIKAFLSI